MEDGRAERRVCAVVLGGNAILVSPGKAWSVASLGEGVVAGGWCTRVAGRWLPSTPDETVTSPASTRTVNVAAATIAAPTTPAPTTKALRIAVRRSS